MKVYGPYTRPDGRQHVILVNAAGVRRTVSYPKYLMEQHLGRELDPDLETVDHKDRDFTNNNLSNLQILSRPDHSSLDNKRAKMVEFICPECGSRETRLPRVIDQNRRQGKAGPFCSKSCSSKNSRKRQLGLVSQIPWNFTAVKREYYTNKD